jgi:RNA polymerase sigma factor (sigma-70 family)
MTWRAAPNLSPWSRLYIDVIRIESDAAPADDTAQGDFWAWVEPHWQTMAHAARRFSDTQAAPDVLHSAAVQAWTKRVQYDPSRGSPRAWLVAVTRDQARRAHKRAVRTLHWGSGPGPIESANPDLAARVDIEAAISKLSRRQRQAVYLHYFVDLNIADVASVMDCSSGTVKSTLHDARKALATLLPEGRERQ